MADHDGAAREFFQCFLKCAQSVYIQVVGGFV